MKYYIMDFYNWLKQAIPENINEKNFLWIIGSLFLLGIVTKLITSMTIDGLIRKTDRFALSKNKVMRQIKMKYEGLKQVSGRVESPILLVHRHLNKARIGIISINKMNNIINICVFAIIGVTAFVGWRIYLSGQMSQAAVIIFSGWFVGFSLDMINRMVRIEDKKRELVYAIVDCLENGPRGIQDRAISEEKEEDKPLVKKRDDSISERKTEDDVKKQEEQVLGQVIGEFLQ